MLRSCNKPCRGPVRPARYIPFANRGSGHPTLTKPGRRRQVKSGQETHTWHVKDRRHTWHVKDRRHTWHVKERRHTWHVNEVWDDDAGAGGGDGRGRDDRGAGARRAAGADDGHPRGGRAPAAEPAGRDARGRACPSGGRRPRGRGGRRPRLRRAADGDRAAATRAPRSSGSTSRRRACRRSGAGEAELLASEHQDLRAHLAGGGFVLTERIEALDAADLVLICVPTPIDEQRRPDPRDPARCVRRGRAPRPCGPDARADLDHLCRAARASCWWSRWPSAGCASARTCSSRSPPSASTLASPVTSSARRPA